MKKTCKICAQPFEITEEDLSLYEKFQVPEPKQCPECRLIRRLLERNAKNLYYRTCDFTKTQTLSQYHQDQPFPVYSPKAWWSDDWEGTDYGRPIDFNKSFFQQFLELKNKVPHCALFNTEGTMENSDYNNCTAYIKNCYLIAESDYCEDCYYSNLLKKCTNVVDCSICYNCELSYECIDCNDCYNVKFSQDCQSCQDSFFLTNCSSCQDCIGCINQRHKKFMIFNRQYTKEEYYRLKNQYQPDTRIGIEKLKKKTHKFFQTQPRKAIIQKNNENSIGDHLYNSKNAYHCFDSKDLEDCRYCAKLSLSVKSSMDYNSWGNQSELVYQSSGCGDQCYNIKFCVMCQVNIVNCEYCYECFSCQDCFGCVGLKKKKYCILNKQYEKNEYESLRKKFIEHMQQTNEYGEFFPVQIGAFAYNESIAMDIFPLTQDEAVAKGYKWKSEQQLSRSGNPQNGSEKNSKILRDIQNISDGILDEISFCTTCRKNYRLTAQELKFYRQMKLPIPIKCPSCRHTHRMQRRNPLKLWTRKCDKCYKETSTSYASDRKEKIYCENCFIKDQYH